MKKYLLIFVCGLCTISMAGQTPNDSVQELKVSGVQLPDDSLRSKKLDEVSVYAIKKFTKPTSRGIKVSMDGNPLANIGSATDAIRQMPLIDGSSDAISVFGKGTPVIYINGRIMRNGNELDILTSMDLESVEIITNPSAKYGPAVSAVILIRTRKRNEGAYASSGTTVTASDAWSETAYGSAGYKMANGVMFFGDLSLSDSRFKQHRTYFDSFPIERDDESSALSRLSSTTAGEASNHKFSFMAAGGVNYEFGKNSLGAKYTFNRSPYMNFKSRLETVSDALAVENISSLDNIRTRDYRHYVNLYSYFSLPSELELRLDLDYINGRSNSSKDAYEFQTTTDIVNRGSTDNELYSGKIELEKKWEKFSLLGGADYTYTSSVQDFTSSYNFGNSSEVKASATDDVRQHLYSAFVSAEWNLSDKWKLYGGLRYDATRTRYVRNGKYEPSLSKNYDNLLPDVGLTFTSPVTLSVYYKQSVYRPSYSSLDNNETYVSPTHWEVGNPELQPMKSKGFGFSAYYGKFILQGSASRYVRKIGLINYYDPTLNASVTKTVNLPSYNYFDLVAVQRLDVGVWHPTLQGIIVFQSLRLDDNSAKLTRPLYQISFSNRFDLPQKIYAYLSFFVRGSGNIETQYCHASWQTSLTLSKNYRDWYFSLSANDIFATWVQKYTTDTGGVCTGTYLKGASQYIALSARYQFRTAKSKYRGKSVRSDEIDRL